MDKELFDSLVRMEHMRFILRANGIQCADPYDPAVIKRYQCLRISKRLNETEGQIKACEDFLNEHTDLPDCEKCEREKQLSDKRVEYARLKKKYDELCREPNEAADRQA